MVPDDMLLRVEKPGRYVGNEINMVEKDASNVRIRFALCFPDVYEVGMSHLGSQILYAFINERADAYCERVYAPWADMEAEMRRGGAPLFALETGDPVKAFDIMGFSLQYELSYSNVLNMLDLAGMPLLSGERGEDCPLVCAGGPCAVNPEPLADFIDFFFIGEAEAGLNGLLDLYAAHKAAGGGKRGFLRKAARLEGVYVPSLYDVSYDGEGLISAFEPKHGGIPKRVRKRFVSDFESSYFPSKPLMPLIEIVQDRAVVEVFRGCVRGCRFCQAGYIYRPVRERAAETITKQAAQAISSTGHEEISMLSLSASDYTNCVGLISALTEQLTPLHVNVSLPSLRIDRLSIEMMEKAGEVRRSGLTFAPEAGSQRMRDVINKGISEADILGGAKMAFEAGWGKIKLYFMIGLPLETMEDIEAIPKLAERVAGEYYGVPKNSRGQPLSINLSASCFVPKPFTPFQWEPQDVDGFEAKQRAIKKNLGKKQIRYSYHDAGQAVIEALLARGDRRLGAVLLGVWKRGAKFEGWSEFFNYGIWVEALESAGLSLGFYTSRKRGYGEILPWDHIDMGISKEFLIREMEKAKNAETTPNCRDGCGGCGFIKTGEGCVRESPANIFEV